MSTLQQQLTVLVRALNRAFDEADPEVPEELGTSWRKWCQRNRRFGTALVVLVLVLATFTPMAAGTAVGVSSDSGVGPSKWGETAQQRMEGGANEIASSQHTTVSGTVEYEARNGSMEPARQVTVQIRKQTVPLFPNPVIAETTTDDNGQYSLQVDVAKHENSPWDQVLEVEVQALAKNRAVDVVDLGRTYHIESTGQIQVGANTASFNLAATQLENRRPFQISDWALTAFRFHRDKTGLARKTVDLDPTESSSQFRSPFNLIILDNSGQNQNTVYHEYGHAVMDGLFGYSGWKVPNVKTWGYQTGEGIAPCHIIYSETGKTYAWYEGFAAFSESTVPDDPTVNNIESVRWFNVSRTHPQCHDADASRNPDFDGVKVEGATANILWDLYDGKNEPHDDLNVSLQEIYATISKDQVKSRIPKRNTKKVKNINTFWDQFVNESNHAALGRIYFEAGIQKPDKFENSDTPRQAAQLVHPVQQAQTPQGTYPDDGYNISDGAQLNYGDAADHYDFAAKKDEWVTIQINSTQGDAGADLRVYGPSGNKITTSTTANSNESVSFRAPVNGTFYGNTDPYRFVVEKGARTRAAGTYTFDLTVEPADKLDDQYEDNEDFSGATSLTEGRYEDLKLVDIDTRDIYAIQLGADEGLDATAYFSHSQTDIDLYLYGPAGGGARSVVARNTTNTDDERLLYNARQAGTHYLLVNDSSLASREAYYDLAIQNKTRPRQTYEENDNRQSAANLTKIMQQTALWTDQAGAIVSGYTPRDPDYYRLDLDRTTTLHAQGTKGRETDVEIYHSNGTRLAGGYDASSAIVTNAPAGTYYLRIDNDDHWIPTYVVNVSYGKGAGSDLFEPNGKKALAYPATPAVSRSSSMQIRGTGTREISASITKPSVDSTVSDVDYYEVNLSDGDEVRVQARNLFRGANLSLELIGPGGRTERSFFEWRARGQASMTATRDGSHYVKVSAVSINQTEARYRLDITKDTRLGPENVDFDVVPENNSGGLQLGGVDFWDDDWVVVDTMPDQTQAPCTLDETKEYKRSPSVSISTDTKINRTRVVQVGSQQPCKVVVRTSGPSNAEVDIFVTLDGSQPTLSNYDASSQTSGSDEQIVLEPADGLRAGGTVTALARGYPVTGDYAVQVEIYRRSE